MEIYPFSILVLTLQMRCHLNSVNLNKIISLIGLLRVDNAMSSKSAQSWNSRNTNELLERKTLIIL